MGFAKDVLSMVADSLAEEGDSNYGFNCQDIGKGNVFVSCRFRLKSKKSADAQDAMPEQPLVKPTVKAKFSECKGKNPMKCRYHGAMYATNAFKAIMEKHGVDPDSLSVKRIDEGTYDMSMTIPDDKRPDVLGDMHKFMMDNELEPITTDKNGDYYTVMYESSEELDPNEEAEVETLKVDAKDVGDSIDELAALRQYLTPEDLKELNAEIDNQAARSSDMNETLEMLGANETSDGWEDEEGDTDYVAPSENLPTLPQLPQSLDELTFVSDDLGGSTGPTLWKDKDGNKFVMKKGGTMGGDPDGHVTNEYYGLKAYRAMGVFCPDAKLFKDKNGNVVMVENFIEGAVPLDEYMDNCATKQLEDIQNQIKDTTFADVLLGNWDAAGTPDATAGKYPNMMVLDGKLCRIDPGGWGKYRAQGALKNKEDWEDGYPNELFTMKKFGTTKDFIQDLSSYDLAKQIASKDLIGLIDALPEDDKKVMQKRIRECRELAETGTNYVEDGKYTKEFADTVLEFSLEIAKRGGREALNYGEITCEGISAYTMKDATSVSPTGGEIKKIAPEIENLKHRIKDLTTGHALKFAEARTAILGALKSINHHAAKGGINMEKIDQALKYESDLKKAQEQLAGEDIGLGAGMYQEMVVEDCLKWMEKIRAVKDSGVASNVGNWQVDPSEEIEDIHIEPTPGDIEESYKLREKLDELKEQYSDLQDQGQSEFAGLNPMEIIEALCASDNKKTGLKATYEEIKEAIKKQGWDTWKQGDMFWAAHMMKLAEGMAMGVDYTEKPKYDHTATTREDYKGFVTPQYVKTASGDYAFCGQVVASTTEPTSGNHFANIGEGKRKDESSSAYTYNETIHKLKLDPKRMKAFYRSFAAMKAVQSAIFANTRFQHADKGFCMVKRELQDGIVQAYGLVPNKYNVFPCGFSDSASYGDSSFDHSYSIASLTRIPVSRLTGLCMWNDPFSHASEGEFGVNLVGLPQYVVESHLVDTADQNKRYDLYNAFVQKNPKPTAANTYVFQPQNLT